MATPNIFGNSQGMSFGMGLGQSLGSSGASGILGGLVGQAFDAWSAARNWKYQQKQMAKQQEYALEQMQKQYEYEKAKFDYTNEYNDPVAVMERFRAAGINPSSVLGGSGAAMSATMDSSGGTSTPGTPSAGGLPGRGAPGVLPGNSATDVQLKQSQIAANYASANESDKHAGLYAQETINAEKTFELISNQVDHEFWLAKRAEIETDIAAIKRSHTEEEIQANLAVLHAKYDEIISQKNLNDENASYVKALCANEAVRATLMASQSQMYRQLGSYYDVLATDKLNEVKSILKTTQEIPELEFKNGHYDVKRDKNGNPVTRKVKGYDVKTFEIQLSNMQGLFKTIEDSVAADWANPKAWNDAIVGYIGSAGTLVRGIVDVLKFIVTPEAAAASEVIGSTSSAPTPPPTSAPGRGQFSQTRYDMLKRNYGQAAADRYRQNTYDRFGNY